MKMKAYPDSLEEMYEDDCNYSTKKSSIMKPEKKLTGLVNLVTKVKYLLNFMNLLDMGNIWEIANNFQDKLNMEFTLKTAKNSQEQLIVHEPTNLRSFTREKEKPFDSGNKYI